MRVLIWLQFIFTTGVFLFVFNTSCIGQTVYLLADTSIVHRLDAHVQVLIDPTDTLSVSQVIKSDFQHKFKPSKGNLTFGYLKSSIWLKVVVRSVSPETQWYLEIPAPFLEFVDFYQLHKDATLMHSQAGYYRPQSVRIIPHTNHVIPLRFGSDSISSVFIKIAGRSPKTFPIYAIEKEKYIEKGRLEDLGYGVFFGILIVMFFYNLVIYLTLQQKNYLLYICTIVCTFLIFASASGYGGKFLWPENPVMNYYAGRLSLGLLTTFLSIFTIRFLEVKRYSKIMYFLLLSLIPLAVIATLLIITKTMSSAGNNLISLSTLVFMATGIVCSINGNKTANYFIAAWVIYLTGGLLLTLRNSGVLNFNFWTTHFVEIGAALETVIIAFALGDRYRRYKKETEETQVLALKIQFDAHDKLEIKVKERTEQLSKANEELQTTLETNKLQTQIIENKNAELDVFFYRVAHDLRGPISSLLGLSTLAKMEVKDRQALEYLEKQHAQVERLNTIIRGLINLTKLNDTDLAKEKIDFNKIVDECIASFDSVANFKKISFIKDIETGIEFFSEWTLLNAIFQNLIENAIKYARGESPYVRIAIRADAAWIYLEVEDNGQGIPFEHQSKIFEMFYRATQQASGTGLGLYILKRSVSRLNGTIGLKSQVGIGSTFMVKLPRSGK